MATIVLPLVVVNWTAQRQMLLTWGEEGAASLSVEEGEGGVSGSELGGRWTRWAPGGHRPPGTAVKAVLFNSNFYIAQRK